MIVDDAAFMRMLLKKIVTSNGYFVAGEACDGNDTVAKYTQLKPALMTMDIVMPDKDGVEATKNIIMLDPGAKARLHHPDVIAPDVEIPRMDGVEAIKEHGGKTIVSDEETSLIFGMPKAATDLRCVDRIAPLHKIPEELETMLG